MLPRWHPRLRPSTQAAAVWQGSKQIGIGLDQLEAVIGEAELAQQRRAPVERHARAWRS